MVLGYKHAAALPPSLPHEPPVEPGEVKVPLNDGTELHYTFHEVEPLKGDIASNDAKDAEAAGASNDTILSTDSNRATWGGKMEFLLTCIGYAVGLGNVWRFPYLCYRNGGGAFLIPYIIMLACVGLPLFFMELGFGQFASLGPITIWRISPLMKGLGYAMVIVSWIVTLYYNVIISHTLFYLFASMTRELPWTTCGNWWNTKACKPYNLVDNTTSTTITTTTTTVATTVLEAISSTAKTAVEKAKTPAEEYYQRYVLEQSSGMEDFGLPSWKLALCLLLAWIVVYVCLIRGIQSLGKVVYFTAIFPYVMLTILLVRGVTLEGAGKGIEFYLKPDFSRLADSRVWSDAATQIFYSLSTCSGGLIAMSSFNKFNNNCYRDSLIVSLINCGTSIFAGFVIFSVLGFMAHEKGLDVKDVVDEGPGLAFIVYPEALARMPVSPMWAIFFFIMMATLGFGSQFSMVESVLTAFIDEFKTYLSGQRESLIFRTVVIFLSFLLGLPMVCKGGIYLLNLVDYSLSGFPLLFIGFLEVITINWFYGYKNFAYDIQLMLGHKPNIYWKVCWLGLSPLCIFVIIIFSIIQYKEPHMSSYYYPGWAQGMGWLMAIAPLMLIPCWALFVYCKKGGFELLKDLGQPSRNWGPSSKENRTGKYDEVQMSIESLDLNHQGMLNHGYGRRKYGGSEATLSTPASSMFTINASKGSIVISPSIESNV
ncbi:sodium- and chloride-dependent glycine transporter 1-like [Liolophura sinensis]|uniref:sodium- and chloride-dependent glycine transporter 1-like n=1 Tax=Liolophura sinensis TaxID=3198878 RepID=UPI0031594C2A